MQKFFKSSLKASFLGFYSKKRAMQRLLELQFELASNIFLYRLIGDSSAISGY